jgi:hypothetical protein
MSSAWKCDFSVSWAYDPTGELGEECGAAALPCSDCGGPAGCRAHACICSGCLKAVCEGCIEEHACAMIYTEKAA